MPVEVLFPDGGGCLEVASSADWSRVLGIDAAFAARHTAISRTRAVLG
jgi:hypothetical protein